MAAWAQSWEELSQVVFERERESGALTEWVTWWLKEPV